MKAKSDIGKWLLWARLALVPAFIVGVALSVIVGSWLSLVIWILACVCFLSLIDWYEYSPTLREELEGKDVESGVDKSA